MNTTTATETTAQSFCLCHCGQTTSAKANYRPGHDAAHVAYLVQGIHNGYADGHTYTLADVIGQADELPSEALKAKYARAAQRAIDGYAEKAAKEAAKEAAKQAGAAIHDADPNKSNGCTCGEQFKTKALLTKHLNAALKAGESK